MAITNTLKSKKFVAGASPIILKGDLRLKASVDEPFYRDNEGDRDDFSFRMFNKPYKELNPEELEEFQEEMMRLMNKFSMSDDANERALERIYEDLLEEGMSPEEAAKKARELFEQRSLADGGRAQYGLGSLVKSVKKAVTKVAKSPIGKAALLYTGAGALGNLAGGSSLAGIFSGFTNPAQFLGGAADIFKKGALTNILGLTGDKKGMGAAMDALKIGGVGGVITGLLSGLEQKEGERDIDFANRKAQVKEQLNVQFKSLYPQEGNESDEDYSVRINAMVEAADDSTIPVGEMAEGGRVNRAMGSDEKVEMAAGIEGLPININSKGVKEVDLRETGGFIPPVGIKEKADDIPAMLSNNEFVFTADAVRAAGGGSVNKGAQRMYDLMKNLESKVV